MSSNFDSSPDFWKKMDKMLTKRFDEYDDQTAKVRHKEVLNTISRQNEEIEAVKSQFNSLNQTIVNIDSFKNAELSASTLKALKDSITALETKVDTLNSALETKVNTLNSDNTNYKKFQYFQNSCREQRSRNWSCRISGFQAPHTRERITMHMIYSSLILPSLQIARKNGLIDYIPQHWGDVVEYSHFLPHSAARKELPVAIFRFHSRIFLTAFMISKRPVMESYAANLSKYKSANQSLSPAPFYPGRQLKAQYDATKLNKSVQTYLHSTKLIARTKIASETVAFQLKCGTQWFKVWNPYADTLVDMTKPIPGTEYLFSREEAPPLVKFNKLPYASRDSFFRNTNICNPLMNDDDFGDNNPPPQLSNDAEFPPVSPPAEAGARADTDVEQVDVHGSPAAAAAASPASPASPESTARASAAPEKETEPSKTQPQPQQQKIQPVRNAKKTVR